MTEFIQQYRKNWKKQAKMSSDMILKNYQISTKRKWKLGRPLKWWMGFVICVTGLDKPDTRKYKKEVCYFIFSALP